MKNELRIIGGSWRGRKLRFPDAPALRPTPDRVRETLFNWLGQNLEGLRCLDLYAGSGALGFEAASRLATRVVQVERRLDACQALRHNCAVLEARAVQVVQSDVLHYLGGRAELFDVVFMDPPFHQGLAPPCCRLLEANAWLAPHARIYIETEKDAVLEGLPPSWQVYRHKQAGLVAYHLYQRTPES